ncbi:MAG: hypothetical protein WCP32_01935 [Bacteroidota bacterium]
MEIGNCHIDCERTLNQQERNKLVDLAQPFVPNLFSSINDNWKIFVGHSDKPFINEDFFKTNIEVKSKENSFNSLALLSGVYSSIVRERNNIFTLHSSAISKNNNAVVFVGESFSGKSTLAILAAKEFGFKVLSLNNTCIAFNDQVQIVGGSTLITVRSSIKEIIKDEQPISFSTDNFSLIKSDMLKDNDFSINKTNIIAIFFLAPWGKSLQVKSIDANSLTINLFFHLSRLPRTSVIFSDENFISKIWDNEEFSNRRYKAIKENASKIQSFLITGNPHDILTHIKSNLF